MLTSEQVLIIRGKPKLPSKIQAIFQNLPSHEKGGCDRKANSTWVHPVMNLIRGTCMQQQTTKGWLRLSSRRQ